jgi:hypothetical protein
MVREFIVAPDWRAAVHAFNALHWETPAGARDFWMRTVRPEVAARAGLVVRCAVQGPAPIDPEQVGEY